MNWKFSNRVTSSSCSSARFNSIQNKNLIRGIGHTLWPWPRPPRPKSGKFLKPYVLIFSRNRACQLDGLLRSLSQESQNPWPVSVLWVSGIGDHARSYQILREQWPQIGWKEQMEFSRDLVELLEKTNEENIMFCTDDGLFFAPPPNLVEPDWEKVAAVSLRLGGNCRYCHPANEHYRTPSFQGVDSLLAWRWERAQGDFRVVYSLDAHIYPRNRILKLLTRFDFTNPNQLEDRLNRFCAKDAPQWMLCPEESCYVSLPINRVNTEFANRAGLQHPVSEEELLAEFLSGKRLDPRRIVNHPPIGPHQEYPLAWIN